MIRGRFLDRATWEQRLRQLGCAPLAGLGPLNTSEWWRDAEGYPFTVPVEGDGDRCDFWAIQKICARLGDPLFGETLGPNEH